MILIVTYKNDYTADYLINKLNNLNVEYFRLNCDDILNQRISISNITSVTASINGISKFDSVWFRRVTLPDLNISCTNAEYLYYCAELESFLSNLWLSIKADRWISLPNNIYQAENKLFQLDIASLIGFTIPKTLVSYDYDEIKSFYLSCHEEIIIKPLHSGRIEESQDRCGQIFTSQVQKEDLDVLKDSPPLPNIYQENIPKDIEIRVTVVGNKIFAASVDSKVNQNTQTDWRKEKLMFASFELPEDITEKCISLVKKLNLNFGAIDLIRKPNGEFVFLEINPNGQWVWIEVDTGLKISDAIIHFLTTGENPYHYREGVSECHLETLNEIYNNEEQRGQAIEAKLSTLINNSGIILALIAFIIPLLYDHSSKISCCLKPTILTLFVISLGLIVLGVFIAAKTLNSSNFVYHRISARSILSDTGNRREFIRDKIICIEKFIKANTDTNNARANILIKAQWCFKYGLLLIGLLSLILAALTFYL